MRVEYLWSVTVYRHCEIYFLLRIISEYLGSLVIAVLVVYARYKGIFRRKVLDRLWGAQAWT